MGTLCSIAFSVNSTRTNQPGEANATAIDLARVKVLPLAQRRSLTRVEDILIPPDPAPAACPEPTAASIAQCARKISAARERGASVMLIYGAHLLRNGAALILERLMARGWITHLATNGASSIHDWEYAFLGCSTESVEENVATGSFGTWDETGRNIHLALLAGGVREEGYGQSLGRFIVEDGVTLPSGESLLQAIRSEPQHPLTPARADLLQAMRVHRCRRAGLACTVANTPRFLAGVSARIYR